MTDEEFRDLHFKYGTASTCKSQIEKQAKDVKVLNTLLKSAKDEKNRRYRRVFVKLGGDSFFSMENDLLIKVLTVCRDFCYNAMVEEQKRFDDL